MPIPVPKNIKSPKIKTSTTKDWLNGVVSALDDGRTPVSGLRSTQNTILEQDGVIRPRPSLNLFGPQPEGRVLGQLYQFRSLIGLAATNKMISMQRVERSGSVVARIFVAAPEDTSWTEVTTTDYHADAAAHFNQLDNKVIITNGENELSYYNIADSTITKVSVLPDPSAPTLKTNTGLTGTSYNVFYAVTANSTVGETAGTTLKLPVSKSRDLWDKDKESITIKWTTVAGVQSWNIYCAVTANGDDIPKWGLLATGVSADTLEFTDTGLSGTGALNYYKPMPNTNSTAGPKATRSEVINGRIWLTGDKNNPYLVWYGGDYGHELDFTPANGGGFVNVGSGTREVPARIWNFRTGPGEPVIKCLTRGVSGQGKRYSIASSTLTYGGTPVIVWAATEDYGFSGTDSPDGLIVYGNDTYYPSRDGFKSIATKPQLQNLLSNDSITNTILPDLDFLNGEAMDGCVGVGFENRLYWALPVNANENNQIWVMDLQRGGAWMKPWIMNAGWITTIADNTGRAHLVVVQDGIIYELNRDTKTNDNGAAFPTSGNSGFNHFSESGQEWARLIKVIITVLRPKGRINFAVDGFTSKGKVERLGQETIRERQLSTIAGWGEVGWNKMGWSRPSAAPHLSAAPSREVVIKINKDVQYWSYRWNTSEANTDYAIARVVPVYVDIGIKNL